MSRYDHDYVKIIVGQQRKEWLGEAEQSRLLKAARPPRLQLHPTWTFRALASGVVEWCSRLPCWAQGSLAAIIGGR